MMLSCFASSPITLTGATKRWVDRIPPGTVDSWDFLKKAFIQRYCPPSKTAKQLEEIRNFKQEGDETLYQAWERLWLTTPKSGMMGHLAEVLKVVVLKGSLLS
ncbi:hypothetical protein Tco_1553350 [Tanacetum coccineum]